MRKIYLRLLGSCLAMLMAFQGHSQVVISQVYGGGGNGGSVYQNDFIELFNPTNATISLAGWSVQYASAAGTAWAVTPLSGSIAPGRYYLVQQASGAGGTTGLPTPDATGSIAMSATAGKVAVVSSTTPISGACPAGLIDLVGYGTANCFEGSGATPAPSNTNAVQRISNGCTDNNNNATDFVTGVPNPRNTSSPANSCVGCTAPTNQPTALSFTPAVTSVSGSFTAAAAGTIAADNYLIVFSTSSTLSQQPISGNAYNTGDNIGNGTVAAFPDATSFTINGLTASTTYYVFIFALSSTGNCYNTNSPLTGSFTTEANPAPTASVSAGINAAEPSTNGSFVVTLSSPAPAGGVSIGYTLAGNAVSGTDYTDPQNGTLLIAQGETTGTIQINVVDDAIPEPSKTISVTLNTASNGYIIGTPTASITLTDNDIAAAIPLTTSYSQDFNSLATTGTAITWADNTTIPGWYASRVVYNTGNGSSNAGALYSFGTTGSTDRAIGSIGSGSTGTVLYGARFVNNTGGAITSLKIAYKGEQWRNGGVAAVQTVNFAYQTGTAISSLTEGSWTGVTDLNFNSPVTGTTAAALDGNLPANSGVVIYTIHGLNIPAGNELFVRWEDIDHSGADHGLAVDSFSIEANPQDLVAPVITGRFPAVSATEVSTNTALSVVFDEPVQKATGNIVIRKVSDNSVFQTISITDNTVIVSGNALSISLSALSPNTAYSVEINSGAVKDLAGNDFAGVAPADWTFTTGITFFTANFNSCTTALTDGFTQYSSTGDITWACTAFGRDPNAPAGTAAFPNAVQINGFAGGTNVPNTDWLISPAFNLQNTTYPLLSFWSRTAFNGPPLELRVSTNYTGGDPALATWTTINGKFPSQTSNVWALSSNINLSSFKAANVRFAFVYTSSEDDGARWTVDDVSIADSPVPPPPSLTISTTDLRFNYVANGATADKNFSFVGNDLTSGVSLSVAGNFLLSKDGNSFSPSLVYTQEEANNIEKTVHVRFAPNQQGQNFTGSISFSMQDTTAAVTLAGTSIDPLTTLEVVNWNIEWFGSPLEAPANDDLQQQNVKTILENIGADVYALTEIVNEERLAGLVSQMPGYTYVISNYGSHTNTSVNPPSSLGTAQKLAFIYKTDVLSNVTTTPLLTQGINASSDISNPAYNYWASGRFPFMMSADVTLNCVTKNVKFILVHAKANTSPTATSYDRRKRGADSLYYLLNQQFPNDNVIILGDFNDDLDQSITAGFTTTSWNTFVADQANFSPLTLPLSLAGKKSTVSYNDIIDHVIVSNEMAGYYMDSTASILNDVTGLVSNYGSTTSDHYPVFTRYRFTNTTAPVITTCPHPAPFCAKADGNYTIPAIEAADDCGAVIVSYTITGATERSGTGSNASGSFNEGVSSINWTVKDAQGNTSTCQSTVTVNEAPEVIIPDAFALPSGTDANTVYKGYAPASTITLTAATTGTGYSYNWSNGATASSITVSPAANTTYTVTVTDANGCQATAAKPITFKDVRGGKKLDKVIICHKPGNINSTLEVDQNAVSAHLAHGDKLGGCGPVQQYPPLNVAASPNPTVSTFLITIKGGNPMETVNMKVYNVLGRLVEQKQNLQTGQSFRIGQDYKLGLYLVEFSQGRDKEILLLLKLR
ncbi:Ig-like domain-containing protein [Terrimonas sp. NA20]|uniref:Ig-like domain-containing protein n=1 Tax=Terrimonas ginsenosidimutans TaxID=2908004 RepID=A0ABS9KPG1_9BACT|nr:Ig-like domain-containing protein [Terrimonas ginsenosidimutans]MCG2614203.1 Ig-like domain-containing protein [Terrimonas ginsenosidimutans]